MSFFTFLSSHSRLGGVYSLIGGHHRDVQDDDASSTGDDLENEKSIAQRPWSHPAWHRISSFAPDPSLRWGAVLLSWCSYLTCLSVLLPPFIPTVYNRLLHKKSTPATPSRPLSPTAYLDGLRGVAALVVYIFHFNYLWFPVLRNGYGSSGKDVLFWQMPVVRVLHSGRSSVTIFFVISGYVLTLKTLNSIYRGQGDKVLDSLAGSLFRRPLRLYLPIIASTAIAAVLIRFDGVFIPNIGGGDIPPRGATWQDQLWHWLRITEKTISPFRNVSGRQNLWGNDYNGHLWTIPTEFKGSLLVFLLLLAFARSRRWVAMTGVAIAAYWQMVQGDFDQTLFCVGLLLAELSIILPPALPILSRDTLPAPRIVRRCLKRLASISWLRHAVTMGTFVFSMHLMSYPELHGLSSPGFRRLSAHVPAFYKPFEERIQQFWISVGSITFILAVMYSPPLTLWQRRPTTCHNCCAQGPADSDITAVHHADSLVDVKQQPEPFLQRLFTNTFAQYLGTISYSLYLWHGSVNHIVGLRYLHPAVAAWQTAETTASATLVGDGAALVRAAALDAYAWKWVWAVVMNTFVLFWVSDVFHRLVDVHAVRLTRRISTWALAAR
ncbi:acyltransferase family-domain-containing protein [Podospora didyma]|uniref:Acyltransferase family-domain-containing protein n=1 Tax=Podospora didyma TaxID=330526 RepID=A0AAE0NHZ7_9PEZI|nr:acyltransferase family-domain-containing protein [Podospora didyma]